MKMACNNVVFSPLGFIEMDPLVMHTMYYMNLEFILLAFVTHLIHFGVRRLGQPIITSAILAGLVTGETGLSRAKVMSSTLREENQDMLISFAEKVGASYMLLIALNIDLKYAWRTRYRSLIIACSPLAISIFISMVIVLFTDVDKRWRVPAYFTVLLFLVHTSSPIVVRLITELKLVSTDIGQLTIVSAVVNDLTCVTLMTFAYSVPSMQRGKKGAWTLGTEILLIVGILLALRPSVRWLNRRNQQRRYIRNFELFLIVVFLMFLVLIMEVVWINGALVCFLLGIVFPRDGATIRTLKEKVGYLVNNLILPVYFGWIAARIDLFSFYFRGKIGSLPIVFGIVVVCMVAKVGGAFIATTYFKIPFREGLALGIILNVKGNIDMLSLSMLTIIKEAMGDIILTLLVTTIIINTLVAGATGNILAKKKRKVFERDVVQGLGQVELEKELQILTCVYNPVEVSSMLTLARLSINGIPRNPLSIFLHHLVGLPKNYNSYTSFYNQRHEKDDLDDEDSLGHEYKDAPEINTSVDAFMKETSIAVRHITLSSFFDTMHEIICQDIYDYYRTLVLIPSHKEQRYDGKMVCRNQGRRRLNLKVLKEAPCTVGILIDRPVTDGILPGSKETGTNTECSTPMSNITASYLHRVVAIFCGGPDDQEAVEYAGRLAMHPQTDVTVVRFLSGSRESNISPQDHRSLASSSINSEIAMIIHKDEEERFLDDEFMIKYQRRFVASGKIKYIEMYSINGTEIEAAMKSMVGMYSLFIVGRGRQPTAMLAGLSDWQECIEIGPIGDMLSSDAFMNCGSVLIIQKPNNGSANKEKSLTESMFQ